MPFTKFKNVLKFALNLKRENVLFKDLPKRLISFSYQIASATFTQTLTNFGKLCSFLPTFFLPFLPTNNAFLLKGLS